VQRGPLDAVERVGVAAGGEEEREEGRRGDAGG